MTPPIQSTPTEASIANELAAALSATIRLAAARAGTRERLDVVPPIELEVELNGGHNPAVGRYYGEIITAGPLPADGRVLDLGCGYGRIALDLVTRLSPGQTYVGLDPHAEAISWARASIQAACPEFTFELIDVASGAYNPQGRVRAADYRLPFPDASFDAVCMISVLTHVDLETVGVYVQEAARVLRPETGRLVATIFLLDDEVEELIAAGRSHFALPYAHGESRVEVPDVHERVIAHPRQRVLDLLAEAGFATVDVRNGHWSGRVGVDPSDFQDLIVAEVQTSQTPEGAPRPDELLPGARELAARFMDRGASTAAELVDGVVTALEASLNASWWDRAGWTVSVGGRPLALDLEQVRHLIRDNPDAARSGEWVPVGEAELMDLVAGAGPRATTDALLSLVAEAVGAYAALRPDPEEALDVVLSRPGEPARRITQA